MSPLSIATNHFARTYEARIVEARTNLAFFTLYLNVFQIKTKSETSIF